MKSSSVSCLRAKPSNVPLTCCMLSFRRTLPVACSSLVYELSHTFSCRAVEQQQKEAASCRDVIVFSGFHMSRRENIIHEQVVISLEGVIATWGYMKMKKWKQKQKTSPQIKLQYLVHSKHSLTPEQMMSNRHHMDPFVCNHIHHM